MYIVLWYRLELALARDKGKVITMDITQIPKSMNIDPARWMHYLSSVGVNFVNPYEEGWDIPGREGGKPSQFNQISALDLSMSSTIAQYVQLMDKVEDLAGNISGITVQRQGEISPSELSSNVERSVAQSSTITEPLFWLHNRCKRNVMNMLLNTAKGAWQQSGKKKLYFIFDDAERSFIDIDPKFYFEDMDVFITDTTKDVENIQKLQQLIQPAMQNGASLLEAAEILTSDNLNKIKNKLKDIEDNQAQQQQAQQQQEAQNQQELQKMANDSKEQELMLKEAELDLKRYQIDQDNSTKIAVAEMQAYKNSDTLDVDQDGIADPIEIGKQALEQQKLTSEQYTKNYEIDQKRDIENKKIQIEREKMKSDKDIQAAKDKAAMEREQLKARTALKNKVTGEK